MKENNYYFGAKTMKRTLVSNGNPMEKRVGFSRAVRVGPFVTVGGTAPVGPDGKTVGVGDPAVQACRCLEIIRDALEKSGAGLEHVVRRPNSSDTHRGLEGCRESKGGIFR
jgi:enamine deaminase RidA (YjgF/YER057c/UK114 family)